MTRCQSRWVNVIIITIVIILRFPTLLPSLYNSDEGYYGIIANDTLTGTLYRRPWTRSRRHQPIASPSSK